MYILMAALKEEVTELIEREREALVISGIGKLNALLALSNQFQKFNGAISSVINLGTAGSDRLPKGSLVEVVTSYQRDTAFYAEPISLVGATDLKRIACGTGDQLVESAPKAPWDIVDMELYSLALFCKEKSILLVSIKYVTDRNDVNVYKDWKMQLPMASAALTKYWLDQKDQILANLCPK